MYNFFALITDKMTLLPQQDVLLIWPQQTKLLRQFQLLQQQFELFTTTVIDVAVTRKIVTATILVC